MSLKSTTKVRTTLALIPYLNCEPFHGGIEELGLPIVRESPRRLGELARRGEATCGPMAVADLFRLRERFEPLGELGIACEGRAHSVLLFARREIHALGAAEVELSEESSTSVELVRLLLEKKYRLGDLHYLGAGEGEAQARLLIGDAALRAACEGLDGFPFVYDLGEEWFAWQALPFVFARWVVSRDVPPEERRRIRENLEHSLDSWEERVSEIAARRSGEFGLDEEGVRRYLSTFRYRLGPEEALGERTFETLLGRSG